MAQKLTSHSRGASNIKKSADLSDVDAVVLAGGLGTRLRPAVSDRPKVLAEVGGRPFLDLLIEHLRSMGCARIILSVGHLKDQIKDRYAGKGIIFAEEESPLGTGGGVKNAELLVRSEHFLVMNGDSWIPGGIDLHAFNDFHKKKNALATMALARPRSEKDYGAVFLDKDSKISRFSEKSKEEGDHFLNAGVYLMSKKVFSRMPGSPFSLEADFFPKLIGDAFYGFPVEGEVVDIGTPERYGAAQQVFTS
jgi:D-glycero-alpha-D-manno-heptose 1-phosphate guanylyltransferase